MITTPAMGLTAWNSETDVYSSDQLAINWTKVDQHDHSPGKGLTIPTAGIADQAITADKFAPGAFDSLSVPNNSVGTLQLVDGAVTTIKINDGAVTTVKIGTGQVTGPKIANNAVDTAQINTNAVGTSEIAVNAVGASEIATGAVGTTELATHAVTGIKIADGAVDSAQIADNAVGVDQMALFLPNDVLATSPTVADGATHQVAQVTGIANGVYMAWGSVAIEPGSATNMKVKVTLTFNGVDHDTKNIFIPTAQSTVIPVNVPVTVTSTTTITLSVTNNQGSGDPIVLIGTADGYSLSRLTVMRIS